MPEILSFQVFFQIFELLDIQFTKIQNFKYLISLPSKFNIQYNSISIESYLSSTSTQYRARFPLLFFSFPFLSLREEGGKERISLVILIKWNQVSRLKNLVNDPWLTFARVEKLGQRGASENVEWRGPWFRQGSFLN